MIDRVHVTINPILSYPILSIVSRGDVSVYDASSGGEDQSGAIELRKQLSIDNTNYIGISISFFKQYCFASGQIFPKKRKISASFKKSPGSINSKKLSKRDHKVRVYVP